MHIINISSKIDITPPLESLVENIFHFDNRRIWGRSMRFSPYAGCWLCDPPPLFLVNEKTMEKYDRLNETEPHHEPNEERKPHTEWLGFYQRRNDDLFDNAPVITICPERIAECVADENEFMFLFAKVVIHELAHAIMDLRDENSRYGRRDEFFRWMEESSANRLVIEVFEDFAWSCRHSRHGYCQPFGSLAWEETLFDFVLDFIRRQPPEYALAYELHQNGIRKQWDWRYYKDSLGDSSKSQEKDDWLSYMKGNYRNIDEAQAESLYDNLFK